MKEWHLVRPIGCVKLQAARGQTLEPMNHKLRRAYNA